MDELDALLKNPDVGALAHRARYQHESGDLIADGLRAYLKGKKRDAAEDLSTAAEEIASWQPRWERGCAIEPDVTGPVL